MVGGLGPWQWPLERQVSGCFLPGFWPLACSQYSEGKRQVQQSRAALGAFGTWTWSRCRVRGSGAAWCLSGSGCEKQNLPCCPHQSFELSGGKDLSSSFTQTSFWVYQSLPSCRPEWLVWHLLGRAKRRNFRSQPSLCVCRKNILEVHSDRCCFRKHKVVRRAVSGRRWPTFLWACRYTNARSQATSRLLEPTSCPGGPPMSWRVSTISS